MLTVRFIDACGVLGGRAVALCDENGVDLPMQREATLRTGIDAAEITVTFLIDGEKVKIVDSPPTR